MLARRDAELKPRPSIVSAKVPCTSSHARTHREHTMHLVGSKVKYGLEASFGAQMILALEAVANLAQPHRVGHRL